MISALASAGIFVAVPITGWWVLGRLGVPIPAIARGSLWIAAGLAIWSVPLLLSLIFAVYRPELIGVAGWLAVAVLLVTKKVALPRIPRLQTSDRVVLVGLLGASALAAAYPADPFSSGWDMGTYASHAVFMSNHGQLDVPYPWAAGSDLPPGFLAPGNVFATQPTMTVRFANLYPAWLAQTFAATGYEGLVRLNVVLGLFALLAIYGLARRFVDARIAALAILFLAFNPAQVWVTRQTLSEIPSQLLIWCGLLLLTAYLARGTPRCGMWAGVLLGLAAFVRIDAFLLLPFILVSHALWSVLRLDRARLSTPTWRYFYIGALPLFGLALAYYALFSRPYLLELTTQMFLIGVLTMAGAVALALTRFPPAARLARFALARRSVILGLLGMLAVLTAYAYFVRPALPPFAQFDVPGAIYDGERMHIEDALPNLGRYLTPGVVWGALLGWSVAFVAATRRPGANVLVPLLIVALGIAAVYIWNQAAWPNHFWAVRRFIPVIIPALVVFASSAAGLVLARLSAPGRRLALGASVPLLVIFTLWIGVPTYAVSERQGSHAALSEFASSLPSSGEILALDGIYEGWHYWMPLYLAFDRPIVPLDPATDEGRAEALSRLRAASPANPVTIVTAAHSFRMDAVEGARSEGGWSGLVIAETIVPVPRSTRVEQVTLTAIEATGSNTIGVAFGGPPQWVAPVSGLHPPQLVDGRPLRWTDGHGRISIPIYGDARPSRLAVALADTGPVGADLRIVLNDVTLFDGAVAPGPWSAEYDLHGIVDLPLGEAAQVEIISGIFFDEPVEGFSRETQFGVQIESVTLLSADE